MLVTEANMSERLGAVVVFDESIEALSKLEVVWVDQGYSGKNLRFAEIAYKNRELENSSPLPRVAPQWSS